MSVPGAKYTPDQKEAVTSAYIDRGVRPRARILELAAAGELPAADGTPLEPFTMPDGSAAAYIRDERKRRTGRLRRDIAAAPPRDAIEQLRRRCVSAADALLDGYEKQLRARSNGADPDRLRQIVRVVREAAALPGPGDPRPTAPGSKQGGKTNGATTTRGANTLGGQILADAGGDRVEPLQTTHTDTSTQGQADAGAGQRAPAHDDTQGNEVETRPGSLMLALEQRIGPV